MKYLPPMVISATILSIFAGCDLLLNPQTSPDTSQIPWGKIAGKISFVNQDEGRYASAMHLYVIDGRSKSLREIKSSSGYDFDYATISPHGDLIAYDGQVNGNLNLNVLILGNGNIATYQNTLLAGFTRHGSLVAYYFYPNLIRAIVLNGIETNLPIDPQSNIAFGPNDDFLVYSTGASFGGGGQIIKFDLRDSTSQVIVVDSAAKIDHADISQDGRKVIYSKLFNTSQRWMEIWLANIDGTNNHRIISGDHDDYDYPMWSPDDQYIVCSSNHRYDYPYDGSQVARFIWLYDVAKDTTQKLININGYYSSWSRQ